VPDSQTHWFPAKRYGWGWGLPVSWQGWTVLGAYFGLVAAGFLMFPPQKVVGLFIGYVAILTALLVVICWLRGAPPRWRWGEE